MNQKYYVFNHIGSISQFFSSENDAIDFVESILNSTPDRNLIDLCIVEIKYYVEDQKLIKV